MTEFETKYAKAVEKLIEAGIPRRAYDPPFNIILRRLGLEIRPVHFMTFWQIVTVQGTTFGAMWGLLMWTFLWRYNDMGIPEAILGSLFAGLLFGTVMAVVVKRKSDKAGLLTWGEL
ncbi:DUF6404 family protein [Marivivens sp. JLT3646]|uniref:DUF6404 family protein n=1 Tax=Marivivens sp. JLT3646 TaxID=1920883 RepID=UPI0007FB82A9|nr:DUF6404 family protein [Marivivens sp. JLT3646]APO86119.1 hypothetical protein BSK21_03100 [Marivivens sp. JLT3646]OBR36797.1 hypothetical protein A9199_05445 [Donghicola sp. JL3646]